MYHIAQSVKHLYILNPTCTHFHTTFSWNTVKVEYFIVAISKPLEHRRPDSESINILLRFSFHCRVANFAVLATLFYDEHDTQFLS